MCARLKLFNLLMLLSFCILLIAVDGLLALLMTRPGATGVNTSTRRLYSFSGKAAFLADKDDVYINTIRRRAVEATKEALTNGVRLLEVEFPPLRANDPTSAGTFDASAEFVLDYIRDPMWNGIVDEGLRLVVFPERSEMEIASRRWSANVPESWTLTDIGSLLNDNGAAMSTSPSLLVIVAPGFNIPEYIDVERISEKAYPEASIVIVNGYISRLRAGFYPGFLYPTLAKVTKSFYSRFEQVFHVSPIAVCGERLGAYKVRQYPDAWEVLLQNSAPEAYDVIDSSSDEPNAKAAWKFATEEFKKRTGRLF